MIASRVATIAEKRGVPGAHIVLAWLLGTIVSTPIISAPRSEHMQDAVAAIELKLSP